jgi:hypothetical protein
MPPVDQYIEDIKKENKIVPTSSSRNSWRARA